MYPERSGRQIRRRNSGKVTDMGDNRKSSSLELSLWVKRLIRVALKVFFRRIEVTGTEHVPPSGATLFCGNHTGSMLDPMMIITLSGRDVRFAAADVVFKTPILGFFMRKLKAVPIRRRQDHGGESVDNQSAFSAFFEVLDQGGALGIFPEGLSHSDSHMSAFKTGPARIALAAKDRTPDQPVYIVPCGFYYTNPGRFRSSVLLRFGEPMGIDSACLARWRTDERTEVRALTKTLEDAIGGLTVNAENWETIHLLNAVRRLYQPANISLEQRVTLAHRFNALYPSVAQEPDVQEALKEVQRYVTWIHTLGLSDDQVRRGLTMGQRMGRGVSHFALLLMYLPLALVGAPIHAPLVLLLRWAGTKYAPRKDVIASTKFIGGLLVTLLVYALLGIITYLKLGAFYAGLIGALLPLSGLAFLRVVERVRSLAHLAKTTVDMVMLRRVMGLLRKERSELVEKVNRAINSHIPQDMERLFPLAEERRPGDQDL